MKFSKSEQNYSTTERELAAIVNGLKKVNQDFWWAAGCDPNRSQLSYVFEKNDGKMQGWLGGPCIYSLSTSMSMRSWEWIPDQ